MNNIITLYNPYYQENVIEQHLKILKDEGLVAFGKVRSKLRDYEHPHQEILDDVYASASKENLLQLFLTDYSSIYVANVIEVFPSTDATVPAYYSDLEVENWFIFDDLRLIVHKDFELIRDKVLTNFLATNFNNKTYAIYGNQYVYPMQVTMKDRINYFEKSEEDFRYYTNIFKSEEELQTKQNLIDFNFGEKRFYNFAPNSQDNLIAAEIEYMQNRDNPLYDFSSVVIKYSKAVELELYRFLRSIFKFIIEQDDSLGNIPYSLNGRDYVLSNLLKNKANYGTYGFLLRTFEIKTAINKYLKSRTITHFIFSDIPYYIKTIQGVRNESVHGDMTNLDDCSEIRDSVIGIGKSGMIAELDRHIKYIK